jgi:hypothetical protein
MRKFELSVHCYCLIAPLLSWCIYSIGIRAMEEKAVKFVDWFLSTCEVLNLESAYCTCMEREIFSGV